MNDETMEKMASVFDITLDELLSPKRHSDIVHCRHAIAHTLRKNGYSYQEIGNILQRHRSTIYNSVQWVADELFMYGTSPTKNKIHLVEKLWSEYAET